MTLHDLYDDMKQVLDFFGLRWHEKESVIVHIEGDSIIYTHKGRQIRHRMPTVTRTTTHAPIPDNPTPL